MELVRTSIKTFIVLFIVAFMPSCGSYIPILSTNTELALGKDQQWSISYIVVLPGDISPFLGQYQTTLDQMVTEFMSKGVEASWERLSQEQNQTDISYKLNFSGTNYDQLNQVVFDGVSAVTVDPSSQDKVQFSYSPQFSLFAQGEHNTFTLKGSKIISSNGALIDKGKVQWVDPLGKMTATISTAPDLAWLWITLLGLGGTGLIVAGLGVSGKLPYQQRQAISPLPVYSTAPSQPQFNVKYCPQCGSQNPKEAGFCIQCGMKMP